MRPYAAPVYATPATAGRPPDLDRAGRLDEDGDVVVLEAAKAKKLIAEMNMGSSVYSTAVPAGYARKLTIS